MTVHSLSGQGDKRERILRAAESVFAENGFFHAKVSQIAQAAGVADGTIYLYFKNKDDLLICLFEDRMTEVCEAMQRAIGPLQTSREQLRCFVLTHLQMVAAQPKLAEVLTVELRQSSKFMKEHSNPKFAEYLKILATVIAGGQNAKEFDSLVPAPIAARGIFGMIDELALAWLLGETQTFDLAQAAEWVSALVLTGLQHTQTRS